MDIADHNIRGRLVDQAYSGFGGKRFLEFNNVQPESIIQNIPDNGDLGGIVIDEKNGFSLVRCGHKVLKDNRLNATTGRPLPACRLKTCPAL